MHVSPEERERIVQEYVRRRIRAEVRGVWGAKSAIARIAGVKPAHVTNILKDPPKANPGPGMIARLAEHWGFGSYAALEAQALVEAGYHPVLPAPARSSLPELDATIAFAMGYRPMPFLTAARREAEALGADCPRREWLTWLDAKWWEWEQSHRAEPRRSAPETSEYDPPRPRVKRAKPPKRGSGGTSR